LSALVGSQFVEALQTGLRRAGPPQPRRGAPVAGRAGAAETSWHRLAVSARQLERAVADLPAGHPAREQAVRTLTRAIRAIRGTHRGS
jgi:hypothetical protein